MPKITPNFHINGQCRDAIGLYERAFGARTEILITDEVEEKLVYHAEIYIGGQRLMLTDEIVGIAPQGNTLSLVVTFDTADEVEKTFEIMSEGAKIIHPLQKTPYSSRFVSLIDKFGVRWELMTEQTDR